VQITATLRNGIMAGITEAGNILDPAAVFVGVFESIVNNGLATVIGDVTQPAGDPGDRSAVTTWAAANVMTDGRLVRDAPARVFRPADDTESTTVQGWYIASAATDGTLLGFGFFTTPIPLPDENSSVTVVVRVTVDPDGRWDASEWWNG